MKKTIATLLASTMLAGTAHAVTWNGNDAEVMAKGAGLYAAAVEAAANGDITETLTGDKYVFVSWIDADGKKHNGKFWLSDGTKHGDNAGYWGGEFLAEGTPLYKVGSASKSAHVATLNGFTKSSFGQHIVMNAHEDGLEALGVSKEDVADSLHEQGHDLIAAAVKDSVPGETIAEAIAGVPAPDYKFLAVTKLVKLTNSKIEAGDKVAVIVGNQNVSDFISFEEIKDALSHDEMPIDSKYWPEDLEANYDSILKSYILTGNQGTVEALVDYVENHMTSELVNEVARLDGRIDNLVNALSEEAAAGVQADADLKAELVEDINKVAADLADYITFNDGALADAIEAARVAREGLDGKFSAKDVELKGEIDDLVDDLEDIRSNLQSQIDDLADNHIVKDLFVSPQSGNIAITLGKVDGTTVTTQLVDLALQTELDDAVTALEAIIATDEELAQAKSDLEMMISNASGTAATNLATAVSALEATDSTNAQAAADALEGVRMSLQSQIDTNDEASVSADNALQTQIDTINGTLTSLQTQITNNDGEIGTLISDVATLKSDVATLEGATDAVVNGATFANGVITLTLTEGDAVTVDISDVDTNLSDSAVKAIITADYINSLVVDNDRSDDDIKEVIDQAYVQGFINVAYLQTQGVAFTSDHVSDDELSQALSAYVLVSTISDVVRTMDIADVVRTSDISDVVRTADISDVVRTDDISDVVRDSDIADVVRDSDIADVVRTADLAAYVLTTAIADVVRTDDISDVVRTADISDVVRTSALSAYVLASSIADVVRTDDISDVVRTTDLADYVLTSSISDVVRTADLSDYVLTSSISDVVRTADLDYTVYADIQSDVQAEIATAISNVITVTYDGKDDNLSNQTIGDAIADIDNRLDAVETALDSKVDEGIYDVFDAGADGIYGNADDVKIGEVNLD